MPPLPCFGAAGFGSLLAGAEDLLAAGAAGVGGAYITHK